MSGLGDLNMVYSEGFSELNRFWEQLDAIEANLEAQLKTAPEHLRVQLERVSERISSFEPTVSVIGQIKAGKSTLLNAMIGESNLLPSDVNPWTSVITGIHLNSRIRPDNTRALFRFFDAEEWDRLVETGGRLGEMAARAGFDNEVEEVKDQVKQMRQTTEERLGDEFHQLLGQSRSFAEIEKETLDRYICYGDPDDLEDGATEGVYADLTKLADLYIDLPGYPRGLCFRDTPGVNDTFMMREQITLNAISESRMCIVVLSAHQALSTVDLALLRIICSVESREVLIFVNRVDELGDLAEDIKKIERDIRHTLGRMGLSERLNILFGSGYWANCAIDDRCADMIANSLAALKSLYPAADFTDPEELRVKAIEASGIGALHKAVAQQIVDGPGKALMADIKASLAQATDAQDAVVAIAASGAVMSRGVSRTGIKLKLDGLKLEVLTSFDNRAAAERLQLHEKMHKAMTQFVDTAIEALQSHIDAFGEADNWTHEPSSLRMMLRSAYSNATTKLRRDGEKYLDEIGDGVHDILFYDLNVHHDSVSAEFPNQSQHKAPTALAKTLSLDLQGGWWRRFWRLGGKTRAETRYRSLIETEVTPLMEEVLNDFFDEAVANTRSIIVDYFDDQASFVGAIVEAAERMPSADKKTTRSAA